MTSSRWSAWPPTRAFCALASAPVPAAYAAVRAAGRVAGEAGIDEERERRRQVEWLVAQLHLAI